MSNIYGFQLDNPTANTVVANMFLLGSNGSTNVSQSIIQPSLGAIKTSATNNPAEIISYTGDLSQIDANVDEFFLVDNSEVFLSVGSSSATLGSKRSIEYSDSLEENILYGVPAPSMSQMDNEIQSKFEAKVGETNVINCNTLCSIKSTSSGIYTFKIQTFVTYLKTKQEILNSATFTPIKAFKINYNSTSLEQISQIFSDSPINTTGIPILDWTSSSQTASGVNIAESTGGSYQEFAGSQTGEPIAINSLRITPLESNTYTESERISQLLQPIKFTRVDANGLSNTFALNPTVDLYQNMTSLDYINLGTKTDDFPLDGNTNFAYQLLPFSKVSIQLDYVQTSNFIFANKELIKEIIELNKEKNKQTIINSKIARTFTLNLK